MPCGDHRLKSGRICDWVLVIAYPRSAARAPCQRPHLLLASAMGVPALPGKEEGKKEQIEEERAMGKRSETHLPKFQPANSKPQPCRWRRENAGFLASSIINNNIISTP